MQSRGRQLHGRSSRQIAGRLRRPRAMLALTAAIVGVGVFSSSVGIGALPTSTLPVYGVTNGDGSRATVAELGDVNGDGYNDYAVGMPYADARPPTRASSTSSSARPARSPTPTALNLAAASFRIIGHGGEMLGYSIAGGDLNGDGRADIAIGAPMAGPPAKSDGGAVYIVYGQTHPAGSRHTTLSTAGYTNDPTAPATQSPLGSRYDGFQVDSHTGMSMAVVPDVNVHNTTTTAARTSTTSSSGCRRRPPPPGRRRRRGALRQDDERAHQPLRPVGGRLPVLLPHRLSLARRPARRRDRRGRAGHDGRRRPRHRDRRAAGRSGRSHRRRLGLDHQRQPAADRRRLQQPHARRQLPVDQAQRAHRGAGLPHRRREGRRRARISRSRASATRTATASPTSRSAPRPPRPTAARAPARSSSWPASTARPRATSRPRRRCRRSTARMAGAGLGASIAAAGDVDGDGHVDLLAGAPGEGVLHRRRLPRCAERPTPSPTSRSRPPRSCPPAPARRPAAPSPRGSRSTARAPTA